MSKRYLITGGQGFLGSHLAQALADAGHSVWTLDNNSRSSKELLGHSRITHLVGDVRRLEDYPIPFNRKNSVDCVIHMASVNGTHNFYERPAEVLDVCVKGMVNVLAACIAFSVPELLLVSSSEVYHEAKTIPTSEEVPFTIPDPRNPRFSYAAGKQISEMLAIHNANKFRKVDIVRPNNVYGPGMLSGHVIPDLLAKVRAKDILEIQGDGSETRSFIYIDDFTNALMKILAYEEGYKPHIWHVGTQDEITIGELAGKILRLYQRTETVAFNYVRPAGSPERRCPDISKLERLLFFQPRVSLNEGLYRTAKFFDPELA